LNRTISSIEGLVTTKVLSIVLEAFQTLRREKISGIPIVDAAGDLVGSISSQDFRFVLHGTFSNNFHHHSLRFSKKRLV